jgi:CDP-diacylglycerol pyrophosphatase
LGLPVARDGGGAPDLAAPSLPEYSRLSWAARTFV